jgi:phosphohistidine phosphatase
MVSLPSRMMKAKLLLLALPLAGAAMLAFAQPSHARTGDKKTERTLVLIRHAKAADASPGMSDFERPLEQRGIDDAHEMAKWLDSKGICKEQILYSPSVRTVQTLELLFGTAPTQGEVRQADSSIYLASPEDYLNVITTVPDEVKCLVIVGHNPSTTAITNLLQKDKTYEEVPTCGINVISLSLEHWTDIRTAKGKLKAWMTPSKLRNN